MNIESLPPLLVGLPLVVAAALPFATRLGPRGLGRTAGLAAVIACACSWRLGEAILAGTIVRTAMPWAPSLGLTVSFYVDGLALLFILLISGMGALVVMYARYYMPADDPLPRFYALLLFFMAAMLGVVTAGNLLILVVFWELTSISSFLLIGFRDEDAAARAGAYQSLIVTGLGGLALLAGVIVLGQAAGTYEIADLLARAEAVRDLPGASVALALMLFGAFTKSAQVPFHFWLPSAMAAPTPVSTYLHSATMVKAGLFLLGRLLPIFGETSLWQLTVTGIGALTVVAGGWGALRQTDLKAILAYSTISQLGLITLFYGYGSRLAAVAATFHILNHAIFKAPLFMAAGIVDHETGERDLRRLGGLVRALPRTAVVSGIAAAAMMGIPLLNGFLSKEMLFEAAIAARGNGVWAWGLLAAVAVGSVFTVAYSLRFLVGAFGGGQHHLTQAPHDPGAGLMAPAAGLAALCVAIGMAPNPIIGALLTAAASAVVGEHVAVPVKLWHGLTAALGLSAAVLVVGGIYFEARRGTLRQQLAPRLGCTAGELYEGGVKALVHGAARLTDACQTGNLRVYVRVVLLTALGAAGVGFLTGNGSGSEPPALLAPTPVLPGAAVLTTVTVAVAVAVAGFARHRLASVVALAAVGLLTAVYFAWLSAPDLVLTQLLVEVVTTLLILLVLLYLPREIPGREPRPRVIVDAGLALTVGTGIAALSYALMRRPFAPISDYHTFNSIALAGGTNVVNVILVDYRGYDTLGEITVLAVAALGIVAIVRARRRPA